MSSIGSDYSAHRRSIDDLEKDYELQKRKAKEREETREAKLTRSHESTLKDVQEENERSLANLRDRFEASNRDRLEIDREQRAKIEKQMYDRSGRSQKAAIADIQDQRDTAIRAMEDSQKRANSRSANAEEYYERRAESVEKAQQSEIERLTEKYRKEVSEAREEKNEGAASSTAAYRDKLRKDMERAVEQARNEVTTTRRQAQAMSEDYEVRLKNQDQKAETRLEERLRSKDRNTQTKMRKATEAEKASRNREAQQLRDQIKDVTRFQAEAQKKANEGRAEAIREYEGEWRTQMMNQQDSHEAEMAKVKDENKDLEKYLDRTYQEVARERDYKIAKLMREQNDAHAKEISSTAKEYERAQEHLKFQNARDKELAQKEIERQRDGMLSDRGKALENQARIYQKTLSNQKSNQDAQIKNLERQVADLNSTEDPGRISSAAEAAIRGQMTEKYEKSFQAEVERNRRAVDRLQSTYNAELHDARSDNTKQATALNRLNMLEQQQMKDTFVSHVQDVETNKRELLNLTENRAVRTRESMERGQERALNEMRRHYEDIIHTQETEHQVRFRTAAQEADFEKRSIRRDFATQMTDTVRGYEKKLAEQKMQYEEQLRDLKARTDAGSRDSDRRIKQALADQARSYDHRIAEMEAQFNERNRVASRNHEDEIEKVKRANALLLSKKG